MVHQVPLGGLGVESAQQTVPDGVHAAKDRLRRGGRRKGRGKQPWLSCDLGGRDESTVDRRETQVRGVGGASACRVDFDSLEDARHLSHPCPRGKLAELGDGEHRALRTPT